MVQDKNVTMAAAVLSFISLASISTVAGGGTCSGGGGGGGPAATCSAGGGAATATTAAKVAAAVTYEFVGKEVENANVTAAWTKLEYSKLAWTNALDFEIRERLDEADEFIVPQPEKAIELFEAILKDEPSSPRAAYALIRSHEFRNMSSWTEEEKKNLYSDLLDRYAQLIARGDQEDMPASIFYSAVNQAHVFADSVNMTATPALKAALATTRGSKVERFYSSLISYQLKEGMNEEALETAKKAADNFVKNNHFKFLKGFLLKVTGNKKEANTVLRSLEVSPNDVYEFGLDLIEAGTEFFRRGRHEEVKILYQEASKAHIFKSSMQRPLESHDDFESKPVWDLQEDVGLTAHDEDINDFLENLETVQTEAAAVNESEWTNVESSYGNWKELPLYSFGRRRAHRCSLVPVTCRILREWRATVECGKCVARLVRYAPNSRTLPHCGPTDARIRLTLPLKVGSGCASGVNVGRQRLEWSEGRWAAFDDSYEHEMFNECSSEEATALVVDVPHPDASSAGGRSTHRFTASAKAIFSYL